MTGRRIMLVSLSLTYRIKSFTNPCIITSIAPPVIKHSKKRDKITKSPLVQYSRLGKITMTVLVPALLRYAWYYCLLQSWSWSQWSTPNSKLKQIITKQIFKIHTYKGNIYMKNLKTLSCSIYIYIYICGMWKDRKDLESGGIDGDVAASEVVGIIVKDTMSRDDLRCGLDAAEERGHEDPVDRESQLTSDLPTEAKGPDPTLLDERWVPPPLSGGQAKWFEVVLAVSVSHYDDVLVLLLLLLMMVFRGFRGPRLHLLFFFRLFFLDREREMGCVVLCRSVELNI